ncbi:MAG: DUF6702 family protein [Bacteroidia bacterium]
MNILLITILLSQYSLSPQHDVPIAIFNLEITQQSVELEVNIDKDDLEETITGNVQDTSLTQEQVTRYFLLHTKWTFDKEVLLPHFQSVRVVEDHYVVKADFDTKPKNIASITVFNTLLVDNVAGHSNVLYLQYKEKRRGFRMHKDRIKTMIDL